MSKLSVAIALLCASGAVLAQTAPEPPSSWHGEQHHAWEQRMEQHRMERLTVLLDLTPAQEQKVKTILSAEHARMRQSVEQAMQQVREAHRAVRKDTVDKLSTVLSPAQMKKFNALMPERGMMMHGMMMHGMGHGMDMGPHGAGPQ
jgi:Spy/CpxP family protein refolding chaperone